MQFGKVLVLPLISRLHKTAMSVIEDSGEYNADITTTSDEGSTEVSIRGVNIGLGEAAKTDLPIGRLGLGRSEKGGVGREAAVKAVE